MIDILGTVLTSLGATLLLIAAWGVVRLPDALSRQHAATKAATLALSLVCAGAPLLMPTIEWAWRLGLMLGFLIATMPIASHLLARAAVAESSLEEALQDAPLVGEDARRFNSEHG